mgnify:CR=1 FL=1
MGQLGQKYNRGIVIQRSEDGSAFQEVVDVDIDSTETSLESNLPSGIKKVNISAVGGSEVEANPELEGDEDALTGIEIDGVKYKTQEVYILEITCDTTLSAADGAKVTAALAQNLPVYLISDKVYDFEKEEWDTGTFKGMLTKFDNKFVIFTNESNNYPVRYTITASGCSVCKLKEDTGPSQIEPNLVAQTVFSMMEGVVGSFTFNLGDVSVGELSGMYLFPAGNCFIQLPLFSPVLNTVYKIVGTFIYNHNDGSVKTTTVNYRLKEFVNPLTQEKHKGLEIWSGDMAFQFDMPNYTGYLFKALII